MTVNDVCEQGVTSASMTVEVDLSIPGLQAAYAAGTLTPKALLQSLYPKYQEYPAAFISLAPWVDIEARCRCDFPIQFEQVTVV
jgi:hypothetical protein